MANKETVQNTRIPVREGNLALDRRVTIGVDAHLDVHVAVALDGLSARLECHLAHLTRALPRWGRDATASKPSIVAVVNAECVARTVTVRGFPAAPAEPGMASRPNDQPPTRPAALRAAAAR